MKKSFLDYYKLILEKVSFDPYLFRKEYEKALNIIDKYEAKQLKEWMQSKGLTVELISVKSSEGGRKI